MLVNGGADMARQYLAASAIDELRLHLVPTILGAGTRLFDERPSPNLLLRPSTANTSPLAIHLTYEVERPATRRS